MQTIHVRASRESSWTVADTLCRALTIMRRSIGYSGCAAPPIARANSS